MPTEHAAARLVRALLALLLCLFTATAAGQSLESVLAPGLVIQGHAKYEQECKNCHVPFERGAQDRLCADCHKEIGQDLREKTGYHGRRDPQACRSCHTEHRGRAAKIVVLDEKAFDHKQTDFQLRDKHSNVECAKCHVAGKKWREAALTCVGCHRKDDAHKGGLGDKCEDCHNARSWKEVEFDHGKKTRFALTFKHEPLKCDDCHAKGRFKDTPRTCIGCHRKDDEHKGQYGEKCESCHNAKAWKPSTFNHDTDTRYVLKDKHRGVKCASCHTGHLYRAKLETACVACHQKDDKHEGSLGRKCETCHNERSWKEPPGFDHAKTRFPLTGGHVKPACKECHKDQRYKETPRECVQCHLKDDKHQNTLGKDCAECHVDKDWKTVPRFDHQKTKFPLRNAHAAKTVKCTDCHETPAKMRGIATDCASCHRRDDKHEGTLGPKCDACHTDLRWKVDRFDHNRTRYPLTGRHAIVECKSCHQTLRYREAPRDCLGCHRKDDTHKATLGVKCEDCHNTRSWKLWSFDHAKTRFALEGAHGRTECVKCHAQPAPAGKTIAPLAFDCGGCHRKEDVHEGRFGRRCDQCHNTERWREVKRRS
ncbi:MAG: cytochrome C [Rubrivivax sp.]